MPNGLLNNLLAYWGLDEAGGANDALDKHSGGYTLTQVSSPGSDTGLVYAGARTFDGAADLFGRASDATFQGGDNDWTFAAWVNMDAVNRNHAFIAKFTATGSNREYTLRYSYNLGGDTNLRFQFYANSTGGAGGTTLSADTFGAPSATTWYLVVGWHDAANDTIGISINAGTPDTAAHTGGLASKTAPFRVGNYDSNYMDGRIGPVMIWKSAAGGGGVLTTDQITALYNAGAGLAYTEFDDGAGGQSYDEALSLAISLASPAIARLAAGDAMTLLASAGMADGSRLAVSAPVLAPIALSVDYGGGTQVNMALSLPLSVSTQTENGLSFASSITLAAHLLAVSGAVGDAAAASTLPAGLGISSQARAAVDTPGSLGSILGSSTMGAAQGNVESQLSSALEAAAQSSIEAREIGVLLSSLGSEAQAVAAVNILSSLPALLGIVTISGMQFEAVAQLSALLDAAVAARLGGNASSELAENLGAGIAAAASGLAGSLLAHYLLMSNDSRADIRGTIDIASLLNLIDDSAAGVAGALLLERLSSLAAGGTAEASGAILEAIRVDMASASTARLAASLTAGIGQLATIAGAVSVLADLPLGAVVTCTYSGDVGSVSYGAELTLSGLYAIGSEARAASLASTGYTLYVSYGAGATLEAGTVVAIPVRLTLADTGVAGVHVSVQAGLELDGALSSSASAVAGLAVACRLAAAAAATAAGDAAVSVDALLAAGALANQIIQAQLEAMLGLGVGATGFTLILNLDTPECRSVHVRFELRRVAVDPLVNTVSVMPEVRSVAVGAEARTIAVAAESRTVTVVC